MSSTLRDLRPIATIILAILICLGFFLSVVERSVSGKLLNDDFYARVLDEQDAYIRLYDQVLRDEEMGEIVHEHLLGGREIVSHEEFIEIIEDISPPEALQRHTERLLSQAARYMNGDSRRLELYIDVSRELEQVKPALLSFVEERIDRIPLSREEGPGCSPMRITNLAQGYVDRAKTLRDGEVPESIPSLEALSPQCRQLISDLAFDDLLKSSGLEGRGVEGLIDRSEDIRGAFVMGDTHAAIISIVIPLVTPIVDDMVADVREELDDRERLELVDQLAEYSGEEAADELRDAAKDMRRWVLRGASLARNLGWPLLLGGSVLLVLIHIPRVSAGIRWLGATLIIVGGLGLIVLKFVQSALPARVDLLVDSVSATVPDFPVSLTELISDIAVSIISQLAKGAADMSLIALAAGVALFVGSFLTWFIRRLRPGPSVTLEQGDGVDGGPGDVSQLERSQG